MPHPLRNGGHSARVNITLHVDGHQFRVAKLAPNRLYFDAPQTFSEQAGEILMHIDGHERRWRVMLHPGAEPSRIVPAEFAQD